MPPLLKVQKLKRHVVHRVPLEQLDEVLLKESNDGHYLAAVTQHGGIYTLFFEREITNYVTKDPD